MSPRWMRRQRQHHRERAHQQHERADRRERDVEERPSGVGPLDRLRFRVEQVGRDQAAEEQALRAEEHPHAELLVGEAGAGGGGRAQRLGVRPAISPCSVGGRGPAVLSQRAPPRSARGGLAAGSSAAAVRLGRRPSASVAVGAAGSWLVVVAVAVVAGLVVVGRLEAPSRRCRQQHERCRRATAQPEVEDQAVGDERQADGETSGQYDGDGRWTPRARRPAARRPRWRAMRTSPAVLVLAVLAVPELVERG